MIEVSQIHNIVLVTHQILQGNTHARKMLKRVSGELDKAVDDLRNVLFVKTMEKPQTSFKTYEAYDLIRRQYFGLQKEYESNFVLKFKIQQSNSSPAPTETTLKWKMEKDWELMSELDKEELIDKKIVREL